MTTGRTTAFGIATGLVLSAYGAFASISAKGFDQCLRNCDKSVLVWNGTGEVKLSKPHKVELLMVGGGGGGGSAAGNATASAGGGGAGGFVHKQSYELAAGTYQISVGEGGAVGASGGNTTAFGLTAYGGGSGGAYLRNPSPRDGGSGGGATTTYNSRQNLNDGGYPLDSTQGNRGGRVRGMYSGGGGGGAGAPGGDMDPDGDDVRTTGGDGLPCSITGDEVWYAGGGGGLRLTKTPAAGGKGGGGAGGVAGTDGLGGGGGGNANGGRGVVILSFVGFPEGIQTEFRDATGGTVTDREGFRIHAFAEDGAFTIPHAGVVEVLLVGGGGGGGRILSGDSDTAAGGGAGGFIHYDEMILTAGVYQVHIGMGGEVTQNGGNTTAFGLTAWGGGNGGSFAGSPSASEGGSGGGATVTWNGRGTVRTGGGAIDAKQGNPGGSTSSYYGAAGGGGAGAPGEDAVDRASAGGDGRTCSILGEEIWYAGGGGGYRKWDSTVQGPVQAAGGKGGGGKGGAAGTDGLGGGGGGNAKGGNGIVVVRYRKKTIGMSFILR